MADRPQNYCHSCGFQWHPRGTGVSLHCPGCRSTRVGVALPLDDEPARGGGSPLVIFIGLGMAGVAVLAAAGFAAFILLDAPPPRPAGPPQQVAAAPAPPGPVAPTTPAGPVKGTTTPTKGTTEPVGGPAEPPAKDTTEPAKGTPEPGELEPRRPPTPPPVPDEGPATPSATTPTPGATSPMVGTPADPATPGATSPMVTRPPAAAAPGPFPPPAGWASAWEKAGDVRVRVCGVATTRVPLVDRKKKVLSPDTYLVVWVEVENLSPKTPHTYRRWQPVQTGECTVRCASGAPLVYAMYPQEAGREWFSEFNQQLSPGGPPVIDSLVFSRPSPDVEGSLTLTLDASRVDGTGRLTFTIPQTVWAARK